MSNTTKPSATTDNADHDGGWIRATSRRKKVSKSPRILRPPDSDRSQLLKNMLSDCDWDALVKKFNATRSHYLDSHVGRSFVNGLLEALDQAFGLLSVPKLNLESISLLCLGLGDPSSDEASMRQLALVDALISLDKRLARSRAQFYDPLLQLGSRKLIRKIGMQVLTENKEGCYHLDPTFHHLVILPHCAPVLLNNLLRTNWNPDLLGRTVLYSNGWSEVRSELLATGESDLEIAQQLGCIHALESVLTLPGKRLYLNSQGYGNEPRSFEGMRIQCFPPGKLKKLPSSLWDKSRFECVDTQGLVYPEMDRTNSQSSKERLYSDMIKRDVIPGYVDQLDNSFD